MTRDPKPQQHAPDDGSEPARTPISIDREAGTMTAGDTTAAFDPSDPDGLLRTYLRMVRRLRDQRTAETITLRRDDVDGLARFLEQPSESVLHRLCDLMGSTRSQRRVVVGMCLAGAMVVTVAVPSAAALRSELPLGPRAAETKPLGRTIVDPMIAPPTPAFEPFSWQPDSDGVIVVDVDGAWDRDAVLDADGRLRRDTDRSDSAPDPSHDGLDDDQVWIPPFPERIVDPRLDLPVQTLPDPEDHGEQE